MLVLLAALVPVTVRPAPADSAEPSYLTLLFGRTQWQSTDGCDPLPNGVTLGAVADELRARGLVATGAVVTNPTKESTEHCVPDIGTYASWDQIASLRDAYGWTFVSTGAWHKDMTVMTPGQQSSESCGSLSDLEAHGHDRAWGLFGYPNDKYDEQMQTEVVSTCFAFGRRYVRPSTPNANDRASTGPPWFQFTNSINGGVCRNTTLPCSDPTWVGTPRAYASPNWVATLMSPDAGEWTTVQFYRFVTGSHTSTASSWDCTSADWRDHWTSRAELYCFEDYLAALDQIPPDVTVTDPASVAEAWGRAPGSVDDVPPRTSVAIPAPHATVTEGTVEFSGHAADDTSVSRVELGIKDRDSGLWWRTDATWGAFEWHSAVLSLPGASSTDWTFTWPDAPPGRFGVLARASDVSGNVDVDKPWVPFQVIPADTSLPEFVTDFGGPGHAEMYPSGVEALDDGSFVVADTGNNQVAKYAPDGAQLWRVGSYGPGVGEFDKPRDVAVASNGDVYVIDTRNHRIVHLDSDGRWVGTFSGPDGDEVRWPLGGTITDDVLYVADTGRGKVRSFGLDGTALDVFTASGDCTTLSGVRDVDADAAGRVYVAGYKTNQIYVFDPAGTCLFAWGETGSDPGQMRAPYGVRVASDPVLGRESVFVADANNGRVQQFGTDGSFIEAVGMPGAPREPGRFTHLRRVAVVPGTGDLLAADLWDSAIKRFDRTSDGYVYATAYGEPPPEAANETGLHEPRGLAFDSMGIVHVADTVHHRILRLDRSGAVSSACGGRGFAPGEFNWPRGVAVDRSTDEIWVADTNQSRLQVLAADCAGLATVGSFGNGLNDLYWPHAITIRQSDRTAWVADTMNHRIKSYDVASRSLIDTFGWEGNGTNALQRPAGIAIDPTTGHVFVADTGNDRITELRDRAGSDIAVVRHLTGGFRAPEGVAVDGSGRIYVVDSGNDRVVVLAADGALLGSLAAPDGLSLPAAAAVDAGRVYVADTYADQVRLFSDPPDTAPPDATAVAPEADQVLPMGAITLEGRATDDVGVRGVTVAIKDRDTGLWWNPDGSWGGWAMLDASLSSPGGSTTDWTMTWHPPTGGRYAVLVRVQDLTGELDPVPPWIRFAVDGSPPDSSVTNPTPGATLSSGSPVLMAGTASDDVGVAAVHLAIRDRDTGLWWHADGTWGAWTLHEAALDGSGEPTTGWSFRWVPPGTGRYGLLVRTDDVMGNTDPVRSWVAFDVE